MTTFRSWRNARRYCGRSTTSLPALYNLVVELGEPFSTEAPAGVEIGAAGAADERTLAWIDDIFGGFWSSEARAGLNVVARRGDAPIGFATLEAKGLSFAWLEEIGRDPRLGILGPLGVAPDHRKGRLGTTLLRSALNALRERGYQRALIPAVGDEEIVRFYTDAVGARVRRRFQPDALYRPMRRTLVLASGNGSNFQAVVDATREGTLPLDIVALFGNNPHAYALVRARDAGVPSHLIAWNRAEEAREAYDARLLEDVMAERPDLVLLLGWMHLLSKAFVGNVGELLNLHPAFLPLDQDRDDVVMPDGTTIPAFRGPRAVRDALAASSKWVGATLHRVTNATDRGPVMARRPLRVMPGEEEPQLVERVHAVERGVVRAGITRWLYEP
jgi:phosphoribosylglycinamide formyltransferase 1